jgi:hypothetical protein
MAKTYDDFMKNKIMNPKKTYSKDEAMKYFHMKDTKNLLWVQKDENAPNSWVNDFDGEVIPASEKQKPSGIKEYKHK